MNAPDDQALREAFGSLRPGRATGAGTFGAVVARGRSAALAKRSRSRRRVALVALVAVPVAGALTAHLHEQRRERDAWLTVNEALPIVDWRSPTDPLLSGTYEDLLREIPSLHVSVLDPTTNPQGVTP